MVDGKMRTLLSEYEWIVLKFQLIFLVIKSASTRNSSCRVDGRKKRTIRKLTGCCRCANSLKGYIWVILHRVRSHSIKLAEQWCHDLFRLENANVHGMCDSRKRCTATTTATSWDNTRILISLIRTSSINARNVEISLQLKDLNSRYVCVSVFIWHREKNSRIAATHFNESDFECVCVFVELVCSLLVRCCITIIFKLTGKLLNCESQRNRFPLSIWQFSLKTDPPTPSQPYHIDKT